MGRRKTLVQRSDRNRNSNTKEVLTTKRIIIERMSWQPIRTEIFV